MSQYNSNPFFNDMESALNSPTRDQFQSDEPKNEWQSLIQHQAKVAKQIEAQKKKSDHKGPDTWEELSKMINDKEANKRLVVDERLADAERNRVVKEQHDTEVQRKKQNKLEGQRHLADLYIMQSQTQAEKQLKQKEEDRRFEEEMIRRSQDSLQREKFEKKRKLDDFKRSALDLVNERDEQRRREKELTRYQDGGLGELTRSEKVVESEKNENYKQFYDQWSDKRQALDQLHHQRVLQEKFDKERKIDEFVQKGIRDSQNKWELEQQMKAQNNQQNRNQLLSVLQSQMSLKEQAKYEQKALYPQKADQVVRDSNDYQLHLSNLQSTKVEKQRFYKEVLDQQKQEFDEKRRNADKMTPKERGLNQQSLQNYKNADLKLDAMIPGFNNTNSSARLNYLVSPSSSKSQTYNPLTGAPIHLASPKSSTDNPFPQLDNGYRYQGGPQRSPSLGQLHGNRSLNMKDEINGAPAGLNRQWKNQSNNSTLGTYNPITNPIPSQNQNPYFRGRENIGGNKNILSMAAGQNLVN